MLDINFNKLQFAVLECLIRKPTPLNGGELKFMRKFLNLSTTDFGEIFGVTHTAVIEWEEEKTRANLSSDIYIHFSIDQPIKAKVKSRLS